MQHNCGDKSGIEFALWEGTGVWLECMLYALVLLPDACRYNSSTQTGPGPNNRVVGST